MHYAPNCKVGHPERSEELALSKAKGSDFFRALNNMTQTFFSLVAARRSQLNGIGLKSKILNPNSPLRPLCPLR
jgi:hypothetical protein